MSEEKDPHTLRLEREDRETFDYLMMRCDRLRRHGIHITSEAPEQFKVTSTHIRRSRMAALNRAEEIAVLLGFEK